MREGRKRECAMLCKSPFYCASIFLANEKFDFLARPELLVNDTLKRVAQGKRMVKVVLGFLSTLRVVK